MRIKVYTHSVNPGDSHCRKVLVDIYSNIVRINDYHGFVTLARNVDASHNQTVAHIPAQYILEIEEEETS